MPHGYNAFVLHYTVGRRDKFPCQLIEAARAIKHIKDNAERYNIDPERLFVVGFSAGGHLAASAGILWNSPELAEVLGDAPKDINRPTGMILAYPVITSGEWAHKGSIAKLCGNAEFTKEEGERFSLELHVDETTCPAFIWHTFADNGVPVQNSLLLADAMTKAHIPFELHIFPEGKHGLSTCTELVGTPLPHNECWMELAIRWVKDLTVTKE
jgi:acetyl esterase/lipase